LNPKANGALASSWITIGISSGRTPGPVTLPDQPIVEGRIIVTGVFIDALFLRQDAVDVTPRSIPEGISVLFPSFLVDLYRLLETSRSDRRVILSRKK
jgi:hypothetical protein